jgi:hypothetical protein
MSDFLGKINGPMLKDNLLRLGVDLSVETNLLYLDVNNYRVGINTNHPAVDLDANGIVNFKNVLQINAGNISTISGTNANIYLSPDGTGQVILQGNLVTLASSNISNVNVVLANSFTSNIATGTAPFTVTSTSQVANLNVATAGNLVNGNSNVRVNPNSNVNISVAGNSNVIVITGTGANVNGTANITGTIYGADANLSGNLIVNGNITVGTLNLYDILGEFSTGNLSLNNLTVNNTANLGNISITDTNISSITSNSNIYLSPNGSGGIVINSASALTLPSGGGGDRPATPVAGMLRWNQSSAHVEWFDGTNWNNIISAQTQLTSDAFTGDGITLVYTLSQTSTTAATIVSIGGVIQTPTVAYNIVGTTLTFTEAPAAGDIIEARAIVSTITASDLSDGTTGLLVDNTSPRVRTVVRSSPKMDVNLTDIVLYNANIISNVTGQSVNNTATTIDQWPTASFTAAKYTVSVQNGTSRQLTELLVTANSANAYLANIGSVNSGSALMTFTANVASGNAKLWGTGVSTGNTVKVTRNLIV